MIYSFFCREHDLRTSSRKFLRVEVCRLESFDIVVLCSWVLNAIELKGVRSKDANKILRPDFRSKVAESGPKWPGMTSLLGPVCCGTVIFSLISKTLLLSPVKMAVPPKKMANGPFSRNGTFPPSF